jgi:acetyltransferase-like isoleucine patch superfamily enzyme
MSGRLAGWLRRRALRRQGVVLRQGTVFHNARFEGTAIIEPECRIEGDPEVVFGDNFYMNAYSDVRGDVVFGRDVLLGPKVIVWDRCDPASGAGAGRAPVRIGDDVWIAASCVVMGGVTIGSGAVVGAGSVVVEDLPEGAIAVGNPARVVRRREPGRVRPAHEAPDRSGPPR